MILGSRTEVSKTVDLTSKGGERLGEVILPEVGVGAKAA